jgi:predicted nucleotidyltransferase
MKIDSKIILAELKNHLIKNYGNPVKDVILFGSQARGDSQNLLDVHIISVKELNSIRGRQPVFQKAIKSGIYA